MAKDAAPKQTKACSFCCAPLKSGAIYCSVCQQFQGRRRFLGDVTVMSLVSAVPMLALVFTFLHQNIIYPYSDVRAFASRCTPTAVMLVLSNGGTRPAVVDQGEAKLHGLSSAPLERALRPPGAKPVIVKAGASDVAILTLADATRPDRNSPLPVIPAGIPCDLYVTLSVVEFDGRREPLDAGSCKCPA